MNELEVELENVVGKKVIYLSAVFYKSIRKTKKDIEEAYNIKIKRRRK